MVTEQLKAGDKVQVVGFGTFEVSERAAREGRNPQTGETMKIEACKAPKFKAGKALKDGDQLIRTDVYRLEIADGQALTMYSSIVGACYYSGAVAAVPAIVGGKKMRLDKFLKVSRLIKRRTVANEACDAGRVMVNGKAGKGIRAGEAGRRY